MVGGVSLKIRARARTRLAVDDGAAGVGAGVEGSCGEAHPLPCPCCDWFLVWCARIQRARDSRNRCWDWGKVERRQEGEEERPSCCGMNGGDDDGGDRGDTCV